MTAAGHVNPMLARLVR